MARQRQSSRAGDVNQDCTEHSASTCQVTRGCTPARVPSARVIPSAGRSATAQAAAQRDVRRAQGPGEGRQGWDGREEWEGRTRAPVPPHPAPHAGTAGAAWCNTGRSERGRRGGDRAPPDPRQSGTGAARGEAGPALTERRTAHVHGEAQRRHSRRQRRNRRRRRGGARSAASSAGPAQPGRPGRTRPGAGEALVTSAGEAVEAAERAVGVLGVSLRCRGPEPARRRGRGRSRSQPEVTRGRRTRPSQDPPGRAGGALGSRPGGGMGAGWGLPYPSAYQMAVLPFSRLLRLSLPQGFAGAACQRP